MHANAELLQFCMAAHHAYAERYAKMAEIGGGAFGRVWTARDTATGEVVAIKEIQLEDAEWADTIVEEVRREVAVLAQCAAPSIIRYRGSVLHGSALWIVMEHCALGSVRQLLDRGGPLDEAAAIFVIGETLAALSYLHGHGIAHRDIKAANILLTAEGRVRVADFGVAAAPVLAGPHARAAGSPYWMAPEAVRALSAPSGESLDYDAYAADVWSVGITLFELLAGAPPHGRLGAGRALALVVSAAPPRLDPAHFGPEVCSLAALCLHDDPSRRPTAGDLLRLRIVRERRPESMLPYIGQRAMANGHAAERSVWGRTSGATRLEEPAPADIVFAAEPERSTPEGTDRPVAGAVDDLIVHVPMDAPCLAQLKARQSERQRERLVHLGLATNSRPDIDLCQAREEAAVHLGLWTDTGVQALRTLGVDPEGEDEELRRERVLISLHRSLLLRSDEQ